MYQDIDSVFQTLSDPSCKLSTGARFVLVALAWHKNARTGRCDPGVARLAAVTGYSARQIYGAAIPELEKSGFVTVLRVHNRNNAYALRPEAISPGGRKPLPPAPEATSPGGRKPLPPAPEATSPGDRKPLPPAPEAASPEQGSNRELEQGIEQEPIALRERGSLKGQIQPSKKTPALTPEQAAAFEEFWKAYPRKVGKGKAREAWGRALREAPAKAIVWAVNYQVSRCKFSDEERYIPHPTTWLNQGRWLDGFDSLEELGKPKRARDTFYTLPE